MHFEPTGLPGVTVVIPEPRADERGFLARTYCEKEFTSVGLNTRWVQHNHTLTLGRGSIRGLHFQANPFPEAKLVRCLAGTVFDVAVDLRPGSPHHGRWTAVELSADNGCAVYIPPGFAHGFQCLAERCELFYLMSEFYHPDSARGVRWDDPDLGISWPLPVNRLSPRDAALPLLSQGSRD
jgi:dTDP-4-dehydrorhamnose 3,5-epimerase